MTRNLKHSLGIFIILATTSLSAYAGSHLNLSSDPSDYADGDRFMRMCIEFNDELENKEAACFNAWQGYRR